MPRFYNFHQFGVYKLRQREDKLGKLINQFLGIGICKHCGYEHPSILGYCEDCLEHSFECGVRLFHFGDCEFHIRRRTNEKSHKETNMDMPTMR